MAEDLLAPPTADQNELPQTGDIPEKFRDSATGALRVDLLLKSYRELERMLSRRAAPGPEASPEEIARWRRILGVPDSPEGYEINPPCELCGPDAEVNAKLHEAGFTAPQAQLVYDLAAQRLLPLIAEAAAEFEAGKQREKLHAEFGGEDRFRQVAPQITAWGRANLPDAVFAALSTTAEGVIALHRMMAGKEPPLSRDAAADAAPSEAELRKMMRDPRYWRTRDPAFVQRVTEGFRRLVGSQGG
ncbi:capsid assembly protein [Falsiroseomonas sp. HW251]|uniref:capsid assembly protein n=1 Tax=Falsiroseomonas sp. HW251 TaxID=3390998 RepID=UPI003D31C66F